MQKIVAFWFPSLLVGLSLLVLGQLLLLSRSEVQASHELNSSYVSQLLNRFKKSHKYIDDFELPIPKQGETMALSLLDPQGLFPTQRKESDIKTEALIFKASQDCRPLSNDIMREPVSRQQQKSLWWYRHKCHQEPLPEEAWTKDPIIHPLGGSWAHFFFRQGYKDRDWLKTQKEFLHLLESFDIVDENSDFFRQVAARLKPGELSAIRKGQKFVVNDTYFLLFTHDEPQALFYHVYPIKVWQQFLQQNNLRWQSEPTAECQLVDEDSCWSLIRATPLMLNQKSFLNILIGLILVLISYIIYSFYSRLRSENRLREQQQLVMQTLAHELRHPVTGFRLSIEAIRPFYDQLPDIIATEFLRLASTSRRMTRVVSLSQSYLQLLMKDGEFRFSRDSIDDFSTFIETCLEDYLDKIEIDHGSESQPCEIDAYWVGTCLKNLVINALTYGETPVVVSWRKSGNELRIEVKDNGNELKRELSELVTPKIKKSGSGGMGLGLSLIYRVLGLMGGDLLLEKNPTRFTILLREV